MRRFTKDGYRAVFALTGEGDLEGQVKVDQPYAQYQHERHDLVHPRGGGANYLGGPLFEHYERYMQNLADAMLDTGPIPAMVSNMEHLASQVAVRAPVLTTALRRSGHPTVKSDGDVVYDRSPAARRRV